MPITIQIPYMLTRYSEERPEIEVEGTTVGEAFEAMFAVWPQMRIRLIDRHDHIPPYLIILHNDEEIDRRTWASRPARDGDVLNVVPAVEGGSDVRMRGFRDRATVPEAQKVAFAGLRRRAEEVFVGDAAGRVLREDVESPVAVPPFDRAAMDGFAIRGEDSFGATLYDPVRLAVVGEVLPGRVDPPRLGPGEALRIMTGAPLPPGADAVLKAEDAVAEHHAVLVNAPVTPGKNVGRRGEDIAPGQTVLAAGRRLRPQDLGLLASIGRGRVKVVRRPRVGILVTGNELLPPGEMPEGHRIVDSNTPMLEALVRADGGEVHRTWRLPDDPDAIRAALETEDLEVLIAAGGSSVGREDWLPLLVRELGELPIHGVAMRPSSPTGIGRIGDRRVFLLPGNPVSCLCAYDFFAGPAIRGLAGLDAAWPYPTRSARLARRISSAIGRVDYVRVLDLPDGRVEPIAASGASILSSTTRASGFVVVAEDSEGCEEGATVRVHRYDGRSPTA
ncbi:MAG: molybdopterin-binding protein [Planctomycetota bacterium]